MKHFSSKQLSKACGSQAFQVAWFGNTENEILWEHIYRFNKPGQPENNKANGRKHLETCNEQTLHSDSTDDAYEEYA
jgi:hypothetical protein